MQTLFVLNHYVSARDHQVFNDADRFIPERWLRSDSTMDAEGAGHDVFSDNLKQRRSFSCLPFGYGNRSCLGQLAVTPIRVKYRGHGSMYSPIISLGEMTPVIGRLTITLCIAGMKFFEKCITIYRNAISSQTSIFYGDGLNPIPRSDFAEVSHGRLPRPWQRPGGKGQPPPAPTQPPSCPNNVTQCPPPNISPSSLA